MRVPAIFTGLALFLGATAVNAQTNYESWPLLKDPFESTGGGGILIGGYNPVVKDGKCTTDFSATEPGPNGKVYRNEVVFDAGRRPGRHSLHQRKMACERRQHGRHHAVRGFHQGRRQAHEAVNSAGTFRTAPG
jgi:hypothetical protein